MLSFVGNYRLVSFDEEGLGHIVEPRVAIANKDAQTIRVKDVQGTDEIMLYESTDIKRLAKQAEMEYFKALERFEPVMEFTNGKRAYVPKKSTASRRK